MTSWSCVCIRVSCVHVAVALSPLPSFFFDIPRFQHRQNDKALPWILIFARRIVKSLVVRLFKLSLRERRRRIVVFLLQLYNIPEEREDKNIVLKDFFWLYYLRYFSSCSPLRFFLRNQPNNGAFCEFQGLCHKLSFIHNFFFSPLFLFRKKATRFSSDDVPRFLLPKIKKKY